MGGNPQGGGKQQGIYMGDSSIYGHGYLIRNPPLAQPQRLRRELQIAHKRNRTEDGVLGIIWWNREYWGTGFGVKRLGIKKEEVSTPVLPKVEIPPTSPLTYPPSRTSTSRFCSIDPNEFVWSPVYRPSPF